MPSAVPSLESLSTGLSVPVSRQAIHKRFNKAAVRFVKACLEVVLAEIASFAPVHPAGFARFRRVLIVDSTVWPLKNSLKRWYRGFGGSASKAACKLQTVVEAVSGRILLLDYHRATRPDQAYVKRVAQLVGPEDLVLFDLGYYSCKTFKKIQNCGGFFIGPIYHHATVQLAKKRASLSSLLQKCKPSNVDCNLVIGSLEFMAVRLVAVRNSLKKSSSLRRKLREDYRKQRRGQPSANRLRFCDWTALVTNVPSSRLTTSDVLLAYATRWQIEIFFRDAKSHLRLNATPSASRERFEVQLLAVLLLAAVLTFIQGRFNQRSLTSEISLEKLIKRFAQLSSSIHRCLLSQAFHQLPDLLITLLTHSKKFHQPSRQTARQLLRKWSLS